MEEETRGWISLAWFSVHLLIAILWTKHQPIIEPSSNTAMLVSGQCVGRQTDPGWIHFARMHGVEIEIKGFLTNILNHELDQTTFQCLSLTSVAHKCNIWRGSYDGVYPRPKTSLLIFCGRGYCCVPMFNIGSWLIWFWKELLDGLNCGYVWEWERLFWAKYLYIHQMSVSLLWARNCSSIWPIIPLRICPALMHCVGDTMASITLLHGFYSPYPEISPYHKISSYP